MAKATTAQSRATNTSEQTVPQASQEDLEKLQEIHELINLMFAELTVRMPQSVTPTYLTAAVPPANYPPMLLQPYWGASPLTKLLGF